MGSQSLGLFQGRSPQFVALFQPSYFDKNACFRDTLFIYKPSVSLPPDKRMKIKSRLTDIDFVFGPIEYKKDHLIIHSHPDQAMASKVYVSPDDILSGLGKALSNPRVWIYVLFFPFFLIRYRRRHHQKKDARSG